jgi:dihydroorotase
MYDLVIAGGRVIDPAQGLDGRYDVAFAGGKVAEVAPGIDPALASETVAAAGALAWKIHEELAGADQAVEIV